MVQASPPDPAATPSTNLGTTNPSDDITNLMGLDRNLGQDAQKEQNAGGSAAQTAEGGNTTSNFNIAGAVALTFVDHDVETTIGSTAQILPHRRPQGR